MKTNPLHLPILFLLFCGAAACGTTQRFGKDVLITLTSPGVVLYNAGADSMRTSGDAGEAAGGVVQAITLPFAFAFHCIEHTLYCSAHALDAAFCPLYGVVEVGPTQMPIEPLDIYDGLVLDRSKWNDLESERDASGG